MAHPLVDGLQVGSGSYGTVTMHRTDAHPGHPWVAHKRVKPSRDCQGTRREVAMLGALQTHRTPGIIRLLDEHEDAQTDPPRHVIVTELMHTDLWKVLYRTKGSEATFVAQLPDATADSVRALEHDHV